MSPHTPYLLLAVLFILGFWVVGGHNRLVDLRNGIGLAWSKVDEALRLRSSAALPLLAALAEPMAAEQGALDAVHAALAEASRAASLMASKPVVEDHAAAWLVAEAQLSAAAARLFALLDHQPALRLHSTVADGARDWREADTRLAFARQVFNEAAQVYNAAIALFPTRLLVPLFGFGKAGRL